MSSVMPSSKVLTHASGIKTSSGTKAKGTDKRKGVVPDAH